VDSIKLESLRGSVRVRNDSADKQYRPFGGD
jgi:hypothetical protein